MSLEHHGLLFLRRDKNCPVALFERTPRYSAGKPDILGVTAAGYLYEIEVKRSLSDFKANGSKRHIMNRDYWEASQNPVEREHLKIYPKFYWFLVPPILAPKIMESIPQWAGLLVPNNYNLSEVVTAPVNPYSKKLSVKQCLKLGNLMANQIWSLSTIIDRCGCEEYSDGPGMAAFI